MLANLLDNIGDVPGIITQLWYLDDKTFVGSRHAASTFLNSLDQNDPAFGIHPTINKCEVFWLSGNQQFTQFDHDIRRIKVSLSVSEVLGSPIAGINHFFDNFFQNRVSKVLDAQSHLSELNAPQVELHLLRSCLSLCKLNHLLRTTPPDNIMHHLHRYDEGLRHSLQTILVCSVFDLS